MVKRTDLTDMPEVPGASGSSRRTDLAAFLAAVRSRPPASEGGTARLVFALDATMSRQPTWDLACQLQAEMFEAAAKAGGLQVQLAYFRGHGEARASRWVSDSAALKRLMTGIACHGGLTQMRRVFEHAVDAAARAPVAALIYVGDAMEEDLDRLCHVAGKLALRNTRAFMFLEGRDPRAEQAYREIARLTGGAFLAFDTRAAGELRALLGAVATYAAGGRPALEAAGTGAARQLLADLRP